MLVYVHVDIVDVDVVGTFTFLAFVTSFWSSKDSPHKKL